MQVILAVLTDKQESLVRTVRLRGVPTTGTHLRCVGGIHLDGHRAVTSGFVADHSVQFPKGPSGIGGIGLTLLPTGTLPLASLCLFSDVFQVFQADHGPWILLHNALADHMIGILLQPSLSPANSNETPCCGTSAFSLKTLSESGVVIGFGNNGLA